MKSISEIIKDNAEDMTELNEFCNEIYTSKFSQYFKDTEILYKSLSNNARPISDDELSNILTMCPLNMMTVAEALAEYRRTVELVKLKSKSIKLQLSDMPESKEFRLERLALKDNLIENDLLLCAYESVIKQVEGKVSYTRELIMGAKKIWDARTKSLDASPINPVHTESDSENNISDYVFDKNKKSTYIK